MTQKPRVKNLGFWHLAALLFLCAEFGQSEGLAQLGSAALMEVPRATGSAGCHSHAQTLLRMGTSMLLECLD